MTPDEAIEKARWYAREDIATTNATHGRKKACGCHCAITDGDVLP